MTTEKKTLQLGSLVKTSKTKTKEQQVNDKNERTAITVKLDQKRFRALKLKALDSGKSSQDLMVEALDMLLAKQ